MNPAHAPLQLRKLVSPAGLTVTLFLLFLPFLDIPRDLAAEWVGTRVGFWLALITLAILATYNIVEVAIIRRTEFPATHQYPPVVPPPHSQSDGV